MGLPPQETLAFMQSPELTRITASLETPRRSQSERRPVRIKQQFALLRSCEASHERKNWLFVGSQLAGERAAVLKSLIESAKLNGHDPWAYLKDVFERLPTLKNRDLAQLLPHNWRPASATAVEPATAAEAAAA